MIWKLSNVYAIQKNPLRQDIHRLTRRVHRLALHTLTIRHWRTPYPYGLPLRILCSFASRVSPIVVSDFLFLLTAITSATNHVGAAASPVTAWSGCRITLRKAIGINSRSPPPDR